MIRTLCFLAVATAALDKAVPHRFEEVTGDHRIVKVTAVPQGKYPSQVSLQHVAKGHRCGGSILNDKWVLTSALCLQYEKPDSWRVYAGDVDLEGNGETHTIAQFILHEDYDNGFNVFNLNNIALVEVETPFIFSDNIKPAILPGQNQETPSFSATLVGWGSFQDNMTQFLQEVDTFIVGDVACTLLCGEDITFPSNICTGVPLVADGLRYGDYGGPLFANGMQVGIMSWYSTQLCAATTCFYTDVCKYVDWINSKIN